MVLVASPQKEHDATWKSFREWSGPDGVLLGVWGGTTLTGMRKMTEPLVQVPKTQIVFM